jgi:hypothetical protein
MLLAASLAAAAAGLLSGCGSASTCPFGIITRQNFQGSVAAGAFTTHDLAIASEPGLEVDLSLAAPTGQTARADAWLASADCVKLFDGPYPSASGALPSPLCRTFIGPVAPNTVSGRQALDPGRYRVFVQAYTSNDAAASYAGDVGIWGRSCTINRSFAP